MLSTFRRTWDLLPPRRRRLFHLVGLLSIVVSAFEAVAALAVALLLSLVLNPGEAPEVPLVGPLDEVLPGVGYERLVLYAAVAFGVFFLLRAGLFLFQQYAMGRYVENTAVVLGERIVDGYLSLPYEWHLARNSSELIRNSWHNIDVVARGVVRPMTSLVADSVLAIALLAVLLASSATLTLAALATLGGVLAVTLAVVQPRLKRLGHEQQQAAQSSLQSLQQAYGGIRDVKLLGREAAFTKAYRRSRVALGRARYLNVTLSNVPRTGIELAFMALMLVGLVLAVTSGDVESVLATLGVFAYAGLRLQPSLQKIAKALNEVRFASAAVDELWDGLAMLDEAVSSRDREDQQGERLGLGDHLGLECVTYRYPGGDAPALDGVDVRVPAGSSLGVVGVTGGGKSTLLDVVCGLLRPNGGRVVVDGRDVSTCVRAWQRSIGVVHQSAFLVDDTLRRNVALGQRDADVDDERVRRAIDIAQLAEVVAELPDGLDTMLGEAGVRLSGGQRQRVTVARALYLEPSLLILDEGTASLDNETERRLIERLEQVEGLTLIMVAHRLTTIERCDQVVLLRAGRIAAAGTYDELLRTDDDFKQLAATGG